MLWDGAFAEMLKPKLYAVVVGVSDYTKARLKLKYAAQDAKDFADALKRQEGGIYGKVDVRLMTDASATRDDIVEALEWLEGEVTARDVGMVFMAGHGVTDNKQRFYYLPVDVELDKLRSIGRIARRPPRHHEQLRRQGDDVHRRLPLRRAA